MNMDLNKPFYLIAEYWLGDLKGFIKIGDDKEEIEKIFLDKYAWLPGSFGVTEQTYQLLEVNAKEIMNYGGERK
jgi:hypothetical protein